MVRIGVTAMPAAVRRWRHQSSEASSATRSEVRTIEWVPRRAGGAGQSKKVRSVPGEPASSWFTVFLTRRMPSVST